MAYDDIEKNNSNMINKMSVLQTELTFLNGQKDTIYFKGTRDRLILGQGDLTISKFGSDSIVASGVRTYKILK